MGRVLHVVRLHLLTWRYLFWPWGVLAAAFAVNLLIFGIAGDAIEVKSTGGLMSIYLVMLIYCTQSVSQNFPYTLGMSVSRRSFYLATALVTTGISITFGLGVYLLSILERVTGGWGMHLRFYRLDFMETGNPVTQILVYIVPFLVLGFIGMFCGVVLRRWGLNGIFALTIVTIVVLGGGTALITWQHGWTTIGDWLTGQSTAALFAGWPVLLAVPLAIAGYLGLRRASA
jgi:hypothetical protein